MINIQTFLMIGLSSKNSYVHIWVTVGPADRPGAPTYLEGPESAVAEVQPRDQRRTETVLRHK